MSARILAKPSAPLPLFFFNYPPPPELYTLSLHDALPISTRSGSRPGPRTSCCAISPTPATSTDRKSTRLNSSHPSISYAVFCLKKKKKKHWPTTHDNQSTESYIDYYRLTSTVDVTHEEFC